MRRPSLTLEYGPARDTAGRGQEWLPVLAYLVACIPQAWLLVIVAVRWSRSYPYGIPDGWAEWGPDWVEVGCMFGVLARWALAVFGVVAVLVFGDRLRWLAAVSLLAAHAIALSVELYSGFWLHFQD